MDISEQLAASPLFRGMAADARAALVAAMHRQPLKPDEILFKKGDAGDSLFVIAQGRIRIFSYDEHGNEFTLRYLTPPNTLGEFAVLDYEPRSASAAAAEPSEVYRLYRDDFLALVHVHPLVGLAMMRNLVDRVRYTTDYLQRVMEATTRLSQGVYEVDLELEAAAAANDEIQALVGAFMRMVQHVREQATLPSNKTSAR